MKKNIIIAGVPRSGKSTLAKRLCAAQMASYFPMDSVVSTFGRLFPETGITHYDASHERACRAFKPFFCEFLKHLDYEDFEFVADVYHLLPDGAVSEGLTERYAVLFLGYPSADCAEKCSRIRADARENDWTTSLNDPKLEEVVHRFIEESLGLKAACERLGIRFVDTGNRFTERLEEAFNELHQWTG